MRILVLTSRFPFPLDKGDKLRAYYFLRELHRAGVEVHLVSIAASWPEEVDLGLVSGLVDKMDVLVIPWRKRLWSCMVGWIKGEAIQTRFFYTARAKAAFDEIVREGSFDLMLSHLARTHRYCKDYADRTVMDLMDSFSEIARRRAENSRFLYSWFWEREARLMAHVEDEVVRSYKGATVISHAEKMRFGGVANSELVVIANGIDQPEISLLGSVEPEYDLVFLGNLSYHPNVLGVRYLVDKILPLLEDRKPGLRIAVAGLHASSELANYLESRVIYLGAVPSVGEVYEQSKIAVVPLFTGSGMQNKVLESLAHGVPCITTTRVAESFDLLSEILIEANDDQQFVHGIIHLLEDDEARKGIADKGVWAVKKYYSWESSGEKLMDYLCEKTN